MGLNLWGLNRLTKNGTKHNQTIIEKKTLLKYYD